MADPALPQEPLRPSDCQLKVLYDGSELPGRTDRLRSWALRLLTALERRITRARTRLGQPDHHAVMTSSQPNPAPPAITPSINGKFQPGETVEVLPFAEIQTTLDLNGNCGGLHFMEGMRPLCGRRFTVKKRVRTIFDERAWRMVKVRDTYLLDGGICDGRGLYDKEGCDRCCFYFWKGTWLRRVHGAA